MTASWRDVRLLLCSKLALPRDSAEETLSTGEYTRFEAAVTAAGFGSAQDLIGSSCDELASAGVTQSRRIAGLLARGEELTRDLASLSSRGIWVLTRGDEGYPQRWRTSLGGNAPVVLFGAGYRTLLESHAIAVVGSRHATEDALAFARSVGELCAEAGISIVSGGAKGIDQAAMSGCLEANGYAIGILADDLTRFMNESATRNYLEANRLVLVKDYHFPAPFTVRMAMARNKLIYCSSEAAVVVASATSGGTFAGAQDNLKSCWVPMFARADEPLSPGNAALIRAGAHEIRSSQLTSELMLHLRDYPRPQRKKSEAQSALAFE